MNDISLVSNAIHITTDDNGTKGYVNAPTRYHVYDDNGVTYVSLLIGEENFKWSIDELTVSGDTIDDLADALTKLSAVFPNANSGNGGSGSGVTDITYAALATAIGASGLTAGQQYRITDYATKHYIVDASGTQYLGTIITGVNEPLIVTASSSNKLEPVAYSALHPEDIIHYDWNPVNWLDDLSFNNAGVIITGFKGVIYFRHDTLLDNYMGYDFRNCKFRRWKTNVAAWSAITTYAKGAFVTDGGFIYRSMVAANLNNTPDFTSDFWVQTLNLANTEYWNNNPTASAAGLLSSAEHSDFKTFVEGAGSATYEVCCRSNHFEPFKDTNSFLDVSGTILSNNVIFLSDEDYYTFIDNIFGAESYGNTFGKYIFNNVFGNNCIGNTVNQQMVANVFGNEFTNNLIAFGFTNNVGASTFSTNIVGLAFTFNAVGDNFGGNFISNNCRHNQFGSYFKNSTVLNEFTKNDIKSNVVASGVDFTSATHVYADYSCVIFSRVDGTAKLSYCDNSDVIQVVNANA